MPRGHLSRRLADAEAIRLFAEHHIVQVRRRKNGEILAVKHATFGWISPVQYYGLQKAHDMLPLLQEFIRGGYQAKAWLWGSNFSVTVAGASVPIPIGAGIMLVETLNLAEELYRKPPNPQMILIRAFALLGPFGDVIQIIDFMRALGAIPEAFAAGGEAIMSPIGWLYDAFNGAGSWEQQLTLSHDESGCGQAYGNFSYWRNKELAVESAQNAENVEDVQQLEKWLARGKELGCPWAQVTTWRDVK